MAAAKKKSKAAAKDNWDQTYVFSGEPWQVRIAVDSVVAKEGAASLVRYTKESSPKHIFESLTRFQIDAIPEIVAIYFPSAEQLKICQEIIQNGQLTSGALIVYTPGDTLDGRSGFASAANKKKRIWVYDHIESGNLGGLKSHIQDWEEGTETKLTPEAKNWLTANAPVTQAKVKGDGGKKEVEVYDLEVFESEMDKVLVTIETGTTINLDMLKEYCQFEQGVNIWDFIAAATSGNTGEVIKQLDKLNISKSDHGALWLLIHQLGTLLSVRTFMDMGIRDADQINKKISESDIAGKYFLPSWLESEVTPSAALNPWRIRKAMESVETIKADLVAKKYMSCVSAIQDLRVGLSHEIIVPYLAIALAGNIDYSTPLDSRYF